MLQRTREIERAIARSLGRKRTLRLLLMVGGILIVLVAALTFWLRGGRYISADDAYVRAAKLMVSTDVSGIVTEVVVREGQTVKAGDVLFRIDPKQFQIALDNASSSTRWCAPPSTAWSPRSTRCSPEPIWCRRPRRSPIPARSAWSRPTTCGSTLTSRRPTSPM